MDASAALFTIAGETIAQAVSGGYGDPLERDPEAVRQDVYDRRVTVPLAREQYGVVLHEPALTVAQEATQRLPAALRTARVRSQSRCR